MKLLLRHTIVGYSNNTHANCEYEFPISTLWTYLHISPFTFEGDN